MVNSFVMLRKRREFIAMAKKGKHVATAGIIVQMQPTPLVDAKKFDITKPRLGITVSAKVGKAVVRNLIKRRYRSLFREIAPRLTKTGYDYVLIGRKRALLRSYGDLKRDLVFALHKLHEIKE